MEDPRVAATGLQAMAPFLFLLTTAFQNKKSKAKAGDKVFMVLVHQRSLNSEDVLDQSQTHVFPKGSHHHTNLNEGKPSGKSHLQVGYKRSASTSSLLAHVKI